jgi:hypothetical protein
VTDEQQVAALREEIRRAGSGIRPPPRMRGALALLPAFLTLAGAVMLPGNRPAASADMGPGYWPGRLGPRWSPDGRDILDNGVVVALGGTSQRPIPLPLIPGRSRIVGGADWSPDGRGIVASVYTGEPYVQLLRVYNWRPGDRIAPDRVLLPQRFAACCFSPVWEPTGKRVAFLRGGPKRSGHAPARADLQLCLVNADGTRPRVVPLPQVSYYAPVWAPRGRMLLVGLWGAAKERDPGHPAYSVAVVDADRLTHRVIDLPDLKSSLNGEVAWSPDGTRVVYGVDWTAPGSGLAIYDLRTGRRSTLDPQPERVARQKRRPVQEYPAWSPNGRCIAYVHNETWLRVIDVASRRARTLYHSPDGLDPPAWSPDSRRLAVWDLKPAPDNRRGLYVVGMGPTPADRPRAIAWW